MVRRSTEELNQEILAHVGENIEGLRVDALLHLMHGHISRRTLYRRLNELVAAGKLVSEGETRASRYRLAPAREPVEDSEEDYVPLSPTGAQVRSKIQQPISKRKPVSYHRSFLDNYVPNETAYLPAGTRAHLNRIGQTPDADRPAGTYARHVLNRLLVDLSWASSRLEGNTYSLLDTRRLIEFGEVAQGKDASETQMILNHKEAIEYLVNLDDELAFDQYTIRNIHGLLSNNLLSDSRASGRLRQIGIGITNSVYHPLNTPQLIEECFQQVVDTSAAIQDPFEQAFFAMVHLPYLQPFEDVNKRVSRLAANIPLFRSNLCPLSFVDVPERAYVEGLLAVYELNRAELLRDVFVWAYERSCQRYIAIRQSLGEPDPFKMRFRNELIDVVGDIVRGRAQPTVEEVTRATDQRIQEPYLDQFVRTAIEELESLHEGNFARFRLRTSEYLAWKEAMQNKNI